MKEQIENVDWTKHRLPHRDVGVVPVHIVYRLYGSVPKVELEKLLEERKQLFGSRGLVRPVASGQDNQGKSTGRDVRSRSEWTEEKFEDLLHNRSNGPYHLANPQIAKLVLESWHWITEKYSLYLYAICVMSNHVHVLLSAKGEETVSIGAVMKAHKNFTAIAANKLLGQTETSFWAAGYFDRDLRKNQFITLMWYILNNPVNAKQVKHWEEWPFTYLNPDYDPFFRTTPDVLSG
ncbi:MAG: transposase [Bacteroidota bacterium]